jgi:hypothetical protein
VCTVGAVGTDGINGAANLPPRDERRAAAVLRMVAGDLLEQRAVVKCAPFRSSIRSTEGNSLSSELQLYFDAYAAAVWTSAHAEWVVAFDTVCESSTDPPPPSIFSVPCSDSLFDVSGVFERRVAPKEGGVSKAFETLVLLVSRCVNPGTRGWVTTLREALEHTVLRHVIIQSILCAATGLHPSIHPSTRPSFLTRTRIGRILSTHLSMGGTEAVVNASIAVKECVRRLLGAAMSNHMATCAALSLKSHPVRYLGQPPFAFPSRSFEAALVAIVGAGERMAMDEEERPFAVHVETSLFEERDQPFQKASSPPVGPVWHIGWMGKGTASITSRPTLATLSSEVFLAAFKAAFLPLWLHAKACGERLLRLDTSQYAAIHTHTSSTQLCNALDEFTQLAIQRCAMLDHSAGVHTPSEAANALGVVLPAPRKPVTTGATRTVFDSMGAISTGGAFACAAMLHYARAAWVFNELRCVDLGRETVVRQVKAIHRRLRHADVAWMSSIPDEAFDIEAAISKLPVHSTHLCVCCECKRVANALVQNMTTSPFNELGIVASQTSSRRTMDERTRLFCAKRSSAALRVAVVFEEESKKRRIENDPVELSRIMSSIDTATAEDQGHTARLRRDVRNSYEQRCRANTCGDFSMVQIPAVGRAIQIFKKWYAICTVCGVFVQIIPAAHRHETFVCCLSCDDSAIVPEQTRVERELASLQNVSCRFCGTSATSKRSLLRWKRIRAPLDTSGDNATLPPPLRLVHYCPLHGRSWLKSAHRTLDTKIVLAHLATNAKPVNLTCAYSDPKVVGARPNNRKQRHNSNMRVGVKEKTPVEDDK